MKNNKEKLPHVGCPNCEMQGTVVRFDRNDTVKVQGVEVEVTKVLRSCEACGAEFENSRDGDWRPRAYYAANKLLREENERLHAENERLREKLAHNEARPSMPMDWQSDFQRRLTVT